MGDTKVTDIHSIHMLPEQTLINSVANFSDDFTEKDFDYSKLIEKLQVTISSNDFMTEQDNSNWARARSNDYFYNPKLFAYAPLTYVCVFLSELCKNSDANKISANCPAAVLQQALLRLKYFKQ